ncbi:MAG TPA: tRNA lysidine(34) synthetase TilS [Vicinamibacterales bacterium]|nr:tRNA lysidine(34) synthetase TilS [Vicinamibacterales bacterium]
MLALVERVHRTIQRYDLLPPGARVLVAASGGADSTALLCLLSELAPRGGFTLAGLAHFNHRLRPAAGEDERFCRDLAAGLSLPIEVADGDVSAGARRARTSLEDAARRMRYAFLAEAADRMGASHIAVGHTRDDQAETVLLALIRGAGPRGLAGMAARRGRIVRPLIEQSHDELVRWLSSRQRTFREDESNLDPRFLRNRVRHELLPLLRGRFSPGIVSVLARAAVIAGDDAALLDEQAAAALAGIVAAGADPGATVLDAGALAAWPPALARRVAAIALSRVAGGARTIGFDHAERLVALAAGAVRGPISLPGQQAELLNGRVWLRPRAGRSGRAPGAGLNSFRVPLSIPGEAVVPGGRVVSSELGPSPAWEGGHSFIPAVRERAPGEPVLTVRAGFGARWTAVVDARTVSGLTVRFRRPGDLFRPLGLGGRKKLQDFFVDCKVPRDQRDRTPIVVDGADRIVWVAGHAIAEDYRVTGVTRDVVILKLRGE